MKSKFSFILFSIILIFVSCNNNFDIPSSISEGESKGSLSGVITYQNLESDNHGGILVTLDKTDGLRTASVTRAVENISSVSLARSLAGNTVTAQDGSYVFNNLEAGIYTVYASSSYSKEKAVCTNVVVRAGENTVASALQLTATGSIKGKITLDDGTSGNIGFLVFIAGTSYLAITDDAGNYTISDVPAGNGYQIVAMKNNVIHLLQTDVVVNANCSTTILTNNFTSNELKATDGKDGADGTSIEWLGSFEDESEIENPQYLNAYFNMKDGCSYIYDGTKWTILSAKGDKGDNGTNGTVIVWKGELSEPPANPELNWAYYNTETGCSYIWNGIKWVLLSKAGSDGDNGTDGLSIVWKGELSSAPENPKVNWAYYNTETGCSYIWNGTKWDLLSKVGNEGKEGTNGKDALAIGTILSTEKLTNQNVIITVNITQSDISKIGYVYSADVQNWNTANSILTNSEFITIQPDSNGKYQVTADKNGYYTFAVKTTEGYTAFTEEHITNIDKTAPASVSNLAAKYDRNTKRISVTWTNPTDSDFDYVVLSYTKGGVAVTSNISITKGTYSLGDVEVNGDEYVFTVYAKDKTGNTSNSETVNVTPADGPKVQSITLSRYHWAYNDPDQTVTVTAIISNADLIDDGTVVKFQTKDPSGNITNTVATVDKTQGKATAMLTAPVNTSGSDSVTYTVLCKIGDEAANTEHTTRFNISSCASLNPVYGIQQSLNGLSDSSGIMQIPLSSVTNSTTEIVQIQGLNLDLTQPSIQLYDSTGTAYFDEPIPVDISSVVWTETKGTNYQIIDTVIKVPTKDDVYTVRILFDGVVQTEIWGRLQVYDVPKFSSFTIPPVSITKEDNTVTAKIIGKNFDSPNVELSKFVAICSSKATIVYNSAFRIINDHIIHVTFIIPGTVGEYEVTIKYENEFITTKLKAQDYSSYSIGDILLKDGSVKAYDANNLIFSNEEKQDAIGVMYGFTEYGVPKGWLGIYNSYDGTNLGGAKWTLADTVSYNLFFDDIICSPTEAYSAGSAANASFTGDTDGYDNWTYICTIDSSGTTDAATYYPVFDYVNNYSSIFELIEDYSENWYLPSLAELCCIYKNKEILNIVLNAVDGTKLQDGWYWSSSQYDDYSYNGVWQVRFNDGIINYNTKNFAGLFCCLYPFE